MGSPLDRELLREALAREQQEINFYESCEQKMTSQEGRQIVGHVLRVRKETTAELLEALRKMDPVLDEKLRHELFAGRVGGEPSAPATGGGG